MCGGWGGGGGGRHVMVDGISPYYRARGIRRLKKKKTMHGEFLVLIFISSHAAVPPGRLARRLVGLTHLPSTSIYFYFCPAADRLNNPPRPVYVTVGVGCSSLIEFNIQHKKEDQPFCHACHSPSTVKHALIECSIFTSKISEYPKELGLYDKI